MDLTALHAAVRTLVRDGKASKSRSQTPTVQRAAFRALKRDLRRVRGDAEQLTPMARGTDWMISPPRTETVQ